MSFIVIGLGNNDLFSYKTCLPPPPHAEHLPTKRDWAARLMPQFSTTSGAPTTSKATRCRRPKEKKIQPWAR